MEHKNNGFTLIELLVTIVIISILATISVSTFQGYFDKAKRANAQQEMSQIITAIRLMEIDTEYTLGKYPMGTCVQNPEIRLNSSNCAGGLTCQNAPATGTAAAFDFSDTNWNGPYVDGDILIDPWGTPYYFDFDFKCIDTPFLETLCQGETSISALSSLGPDKSGTYEDNEIIPFCIP